MSPEAQRIAIAEACGWKNHDHPDCMALKDGWVMPEKWCLSPDGKLSLNHDRPDYLNDLNAMHDAEKAVEKEVFYMMNLVKVMKESGTIGTRSDRTYRATAAQRAEAFLKTLNLWKP